MMEINNIIQDMNVILKEKMALDIEGTVENHSSFLSEGFNLDSVTILEFIIELEVQYDIQIDEDELEVNHFNKASNLAKYLVGKMS